MRGQTLWTLWYSMFTLHMYFVTGYHPSKRGPRSFRPYLFSSTADPRIIFFSKLSVVIFVISATHLRMPLAFLKTVLQWVSPPPPPCPPLRSQPLCGMMTILTITSRASSIIVRLRSSQEDRFQRTPVTSSLTSLSAVLRSRRTRAFVPPAALIARLFSSFCRP
jgi:hypothetical protein